MRSPVWPIFVFSVFVADSASATRRVCEGGGPPPAAHAAQGAERLVRAIFTASGVQGRGPAVGVSAEVDELCVTARGVFLNPSDLSDAELAGRPEQAGATPKLAYALGVWAARHLLDASAAELYAASQAGCTLARLGIHGDVLTTMVLELRGWSGPHPRARAWTRALMKGHGRCAG